MDNFNLKNYLTESKLLKEYDDAWVEKFLSQNGTKHVSYKSGKGVEMTDEDWAQHKGKYTITNGRIGYVKDDGSLHSVKLASSVGENDAIIRYMNDNYESDGSVPVVSEGMLDNALDALYEKMQNMAGEDLDEFLEFYAPDIDNRDANAITDWVYGLSEDDAHTILDDLKDIDDALGVNENKKNVKEVNVDGGLDSNAFAKIQAIADVYSYGEILDALESFYTKNDEIASGNMARKHAGEFRAYLDARTEIDE